MRTPLAKAVKGGFKDTGLDYIIYVLLKETLAKSNIDPALIEDVCLGNVSVYEAIFTFTFLLLIMGDDTDERSSPRSTMERLLISFVQPPLRPEFPILQAPLR